MWNAVTIKSSYSGLPLSRICNRNKYEIAQFEIRQWFLFMTASSELLYSSIRGKWVCVRDSGRFEVASSRLLYKINQRN